MPRDSKTQEQTSEYLKLMAGAIVHLDCSIELWEEIHRLTKEELLDLTRMAMTKDGDGGLHSAGYQARAQEMAIRIEMLEELLSQLNLITKNPEED